MDMKIEFVLKKYSAAKGIVYVPSNNDKEQFAESPEGWWMLHPSTNLLLAVLVHRCNPDITGDPTELAPGQTRQSIRAGTSAGSYEQSLQALRVRPSPKVETLSEGDPTSDSGVTNRSTPLK